MPYTLDHLCTDETGQESWYLCEEKKGRQVPIKMFESREEAEAEKKKLEGK